MWIIGMTGMIAGGKSTLAHQLQTWGAVHIDADRIAGEVTRRPAVIQQIAAALGSHLVAGDGSLNRAETAAIVFGDNQQSRDQLNRLESIVHPLVSGEIRRRIVDAAANLDAEAGPAGDRNGSRCIVLDVPLLIRSGWVGGCDDVICAVCDASTLQHRLDDRGWSHQQYCQRMQRQAPLAIKRRHASLVIDTGDTARASQRLEKFYRGRTECLPPRVPTCQIGCSGSMSTSSPLA